MLANLYSKTDFSLEWKLEIKLKFCASNRSNPKYFHFLDRQNIFHKLWIYCTGDELGHTNNRPYDKLWILMQKFRRNFLVKTRLFVSKVITKRKAFKTSSQDSYMNLSL